MGEPQNSPHARPESCPWRACVLTPAHQGQPESLRIHNFPQQRRPFLELRPPESLLRARAKVTRSNFLALSRQKVTRASAVALVPGASATALALGKLNGPTGVTCSRRREQVTRSNFLALSRQKVTRASAKALAPGKPNALARSVYSGPFNFLRVIARGARNYSGTEICKFSSRIEADLLRQ